MGYTTTTLMFTALAHQWTPTASERRFSLPPPSLRLFEVALRTTAKHYFGGHEPAYHAALNWDRKRLREIGAHRRAPYFACTEYGNGREAIAHLKELLSAESVRFASNSDEFGACFFVTASHEQATFISSQPEQFGELLSVGPFPSALKLAPGLLLDREDGENSPDRLSTTYGARMRMSNVEGLSVELSPGSLRLHDPETFQFFSTLLEDLTFKSLNLHTLNVWSDPDTAGAEHHLTEVGARLSLEWTRAASVVHELSEEIGTSPADICSWQGISLHQAGNDVLIVSGALQR